jgi:lipoate-protein ligase B
MDYNINQFQKEYPHLNFKKINQYWIIEAFPIDYSEFLELQDKLTEWVRSSNEKVLICCNHKTLVTHGRGDRQNKDLGNSSVIPKGIPEHHIKRGGGLTLHHENQWIFYPILKLDAHKWTLNFHLQWMMNIVSTVLKKKWNIETKSLRNPLGVWGGEHKLASIGVGVNRFVSNHGLALNLNRSDLDPNDFLALSPCGLNSKVYSSVSEVLAEEIDVETFQKEFVIYLESENIDWASTLTN